MRFKRMQDLDLRGQRVFIRADLNVPLDDAGGVATSAIWNTAYREWLTTLAP